MEGNGRGIKGRREGNGIEIDSERGEKKKGIIEMLMERGE